MMNQETDPANGQENGESRLRSLGRILRGLMLLSSVLVGLILAGLIIMETLSMGRIQQIRQGLQTFGEWWMFVRIGFIVVLAVYWVEISTWWARRNRWTEGHLQHVLARRWVALGVLGFVELILIQRLHEPLTDRFLR